MRTRLRNAAQRLFGRTTSSRNLVLTGLLALLTLGVLTLVGATLTSLVASAGGSQRSLLPSTPVGGNQPKQGIRLPQKLGVPAIPVGANAPAGGPAFTAADATAYVNTHPVPMATESGPHTVTSVEFLTNGQLNARRSGGYALGLPDSTLLCYVEVQGSITDRGPAGTRPVTYQRVYEIFDATTGYQLAVGAD